MIAGRAGAAGGSPATVLVADDDQPRGTQTRGVLEQDGYRVIAAADGASALRQLAAHGSDLVLCEALLPDMDGFDVCRASKQARATSAIPVVLLLDVDDDVQRERALQAGADDVLVHPVDASLLLAVVRAQLQMQELHAKLNELEGIVFTLARAIEDRDHSSAGLSEKVAHWAMQLGRATGLPDDQLTLLYKAALLHDIGTVAVPVDVLSKHSRLDPGEFNQVKRHPLIGEEIVRALPRSEPLLPAVRHHHERFDGAGYPDGIRGDAIPLFARIIAVADAFVAMTSDRPYRARRSKEEAVNTLQQGAGKQWDATLVERFLPLVARPGAEAVSTAETAG
ncbi:MAG TPA: HD domain-containing phosphohydrolase [Candidatus Dormibacteraeota bacterium]|nr:HD domain-containing phosphohydrolase [Candidatus Dormibacteraeota bacterium]